jgi:hypothetical protein
MTRTALLCAALLLAAAPAAFAAESANYINELYTFSNGGGHATGTGLATMDACIGQPAVGTTYDTVDPNKSSVSYYAPVFFGTPFYIDLEPGYNLISLPVSPASSYTAESLAQLINSQSGTCTAVVAYVNGAYVTHPTGSTQDVFDVSVGKGYFVRVNAASRLSISGFAFSRSSAQLTLETGYTLIGLPLVANPAYDSESATVEINGQPLGSVTQFIRYETGAFYTHPAGSTEEVFTLELGRGYFIRSNAGSTWTLSQ